MKGLWKSGTCKSLKKYMKMNRYIKVFVLCIVLTLAVYSIPIFFPGFELLLLPVYVIMFGIWVFGIIALPFVLYRIYKRRSVPLRLKSVISASTGFVVGLILNTPISNWDEEQRNLSGRILYNEINIYMQEKGYYPESLSSLNQLKLDQSLPSNYKTDRFIYHLTDDGFDLNIQIPIMDRWHWNEEAQEFEYDDF